MQSELGSSRFKPLPAGEREICRRLAAIRRFEGLEQAGLGQRLGITRNQVANIEAARVPLKADVAVRFCLMLDVNPQWLARGVGSPRYYGDPAVAGLLNKVSPGSLPFGAWFEETLGEDLNKLIAEAKDRSEEMATKVSAFTETLVGLKHTAKNRAMVLGVGKALDQLARALKRDRIQRRKIRKFVDASRVDSGSSEDEKELLTDSSEVRMSSADMKSEMRKITLQKVLADVRLLVGARGMKARLAADLDVPQPRVSEWLAGKYEPSGQTALRLARWVELQGRKSK